MSNWRSDVESALSAFVSVTELAGDPIRHDEIVVEFLEAPHRSPSSLPKGKMAIYGFWADGVWLKFGKAGPKSQARFTTHHYGVNSLSTLAKSLVADPRFADVADFDPLQPGAWIRQSTNRLNLLLPVERGPEMLSLLEAFLHVRFKPRYEGFASQRIGAGGQIA